MIDGSGQQMVGGGSTSLPRLGVSLPSPKFPGETASQASRRFKNVLPSGTSVTGSPSTTRKNVAPPDGTVNRSLRV